MCFILLAQLVYWLASTGSKFHQLASIMIFRFSLLFSLWFVFVHLQLVCGFPSLCLNDFTFFFHLCFLAFALHLCMCSWYLDGFPSTVFLMILFSFFWFAFVQLVCGCFKQQYCVYNDFICFHLCSWYVGGYCAQVQAAKCMQSMHQHQTSVWTLLTVVLKKYVAHLVKNELSSIHGHCAL